MVRVTVKVRITVRVMVRVRVMVGCLIRSVHGRDVRGGSLWVGPRM